MVIDQDHRRVEALRSRGVPAIYGDAATPGVLEAAGTASARLIVIATPDGYQARRVIALARKIKPGIDTAVRTHSEAEVAHLERQGVGVAIAGERELAFGLMDYALRSLGVSLRQGAARGPGLARLGRGRRLRAAPVRACAPRTGTQAPSAARLTSSLSASRARVTTLKGCQPPPIPLIAQVVISSGQLPSSGVITIAQTRLRSFAYPQAPSAPHDLWRLGARFHAEP